jgi:hypothetical protein
MGHPAVLLGVAISLLAVATASSAVLSTAGHLVDPQDIKKTIKQVNCLIHHDVCSSFLLLLDLSFYKAYMEVFFFLLLLDLSLKRARGMCAGQRRCHRLCRYQQAAKLEGSFVQGSQNPGSLARITSDRDDDRRWSSYN